MFFSDSLAHWLIWTLTAVVGVCTVLLVALAIRLKISHSTVQAGPELVRQLQRVWRAPILNDPALARRIVEIITARVLKEDYCTTITIIPDHVGTARARNGRRASPVAIRLEVKTSFRLANVTSNDLSLRISQTGDVVMSVTKKPSLTSLAIDGEDLPVHTSSSDGRASYDISIPAETSRLVSITSICSGELPLILELPQTLVVRGGATIQVVSYVQGRIGLVVVGSTESSYCYDWYQGRIPWERTVQTGKPLLPGESIMLFVGTGKATFRGSSLLGFSREAEESV